jgi:hypothetical protein
MYQRITKELAEDKDFRKQMEEIMAIMSYVDGCPPFILLEELKGYTGSTVTQLSHMAI